MEKPARSSPKLMEKQAGGPPEIKIVLIRDGSSFERPAVARDDKLKHELSQEGRFRQPVRKKRDKARLLLNSEAEVQIRKKAWKEGQETVQVYSTNEAKLLSEPPPQPSPNAPQPSFFAICKRTATTAALSPNKHHRHLLIIRVHRKTC